MNDGKDPLCIMQPELAQLFYICALIMYFININE